MTNVSTFKYGLSQVLNGVLKFFSLFFMRLKCLSVGFPSILYFLGYFAKTEYFVGSMSSGVFRSMVPQLGASCLHFLGFL